MVWVMGCWFVPFFFLRKQVGFFVCIEAVAGGREGVDLYLLFSCV